MKFKRIFLIVLDSFGIGELEDANLFDDVGSNTLKSISESTYLNIPFLKKMGLFNIDGLNFKKENDTIGSYGKSKEKSNGKDTTTGHFEMMGIITEKMMPVYLNGIPKEKIDEFKRITGKDIICNKAYSGTEVIKDYGKEHIKTGKLIGYTSSDSVFQIAAHEDVIPLEQLYYYCEVMRNILDVGRIIARPFNGEYPYTRTLNRKDYALTPKYNTMNYLCDNKLDVISVGKIYDIFNKNGITKVITAHCNNESMKGIEEANKIDFKGLCFANLVDFDMLYGHRNDIDGYAKALSTFDKWLSEFVTTINKDDLIIITADHGCDPKTISTNHSREYTPILIYGNIKNSNLGIRNTFADIGKTILDNFEIENNLEGTSFLKEL